jgi:nitrite reductase (NO-forming)
MSTIEEPARYGTSARGRIAPGTHPHPSVRLVAALRTAFGLVWIVDAVLKWLPGFRDGFGTMVNQAANSQPRWLRPLFDLWTGLSHGEATTMAYASAATETFLAFALITGFARRSVYLLGAGYSLMIWVIGEGFGAPYQSGTTDVGAAIIYTFVFAALFLMDRSGPNTYSLDAWLDARISWWHPVAELQPGARTSDRVPGTSTGYPGSPGY